MPRSGPLLLGKTVHRSGPKDLGLGLGLIKVRVRVRVRVRVN